MSEPTVSAGIVRALLNFAVSKGADAATITGRAAIAPDDVLDPDSRIPLARYIALLRAGKELCNDPALALHFGEAVDMSEMSIVGLIGGAAETVHDAFVQVNRYRDLIIEVDVPDGRRFELQPTKDGLWIIDVRRNPNDMPEITESSFARIICGAQRFAAHAATLPANAQAQAFASVATVKAIHVTHKAPPYAAEYGRILRAPVTFESDKNAFLIDADETWLSHRLSSSPRYVFGVLSQHADALLKNLEASKTIRGRVESLLLPILHTGDISKDAIATKLALGPDTLLRRLKAEGTTFEGVVDDLRYKMALHYLNGKKVSITETAYLVGFSEVAAFSRAFKRWTGTSPRKRT